MRKSKRAAGLAGTLCFIALLTTVAFAMSGFSISHMTIGRRTLNDKVAGDLAESAANLALAKLMEDPHWSGDIDYSPSDFPGASGRVTFSTTQALAWKVAASHNNLLGKQSIDGSERKLAPETVQIVATGRYNGISKRHEVILHVPPYGYALVASGQLQSTGGMVVAGVEDPSLLANGLKALSPQQLKAGYLASNGSADDAVELQSSATAPTRITGGVESVGGIELGAHTSIAGPVREHASPVRMVSFEVTDYDPKDRSDAQELHTNIYPELPINGVTRRQGDLLVTNGLNIKRGYLYVDGNLTVQGGLHGQGCIFATGDVKISGVSTFVADSKEAILAKGNVELSGSDQDKSIFQGVVYSEGNFTAKQVTLLGTVMAGKTLISNSVTGVTATTSGGGVSLDRVNLVHCPQVVATEWDSGFLPSAWVGGDEMPHFSKDATGLRSEPGVDIANKPRDFFDAVQGIFTPNPTDHTLTPKFEIAVPEYADQATGREYKFSSLDELLAVLSNPGREQKIVANSVTTPPTMIPRSREVTMPDGTTVMEAYFEEGGGNQSVTDASDPVFLASVRRYVNTVQEINFNSYLPGLLERYQAEYQHHRPWMSLDRWGMSFDPNEFLQLSDKARKLWVHQSPVK
jgi:hypothetical protein